MTYLLALLLPLAFLYSPPVEKTNLVLVTKPLVISQEKNTPAFSLFQQTQKITEVEKNYTIPAATDSSQVVVQLNTETVRAAGDEVHVPEMSLAKTELNIQVSRQLQSLAKSTQDSTLPLFDQVQFTAPLQDEVKGAVIRGFFELKDGVGIVDHKVSLRRVFEGQVLEMGQVDLKAGQYQIAVGAFEGELVAEITDKLGLIIGEDRRKILNLSRTGHYFQGPILSLGRPSGFAVNTQQADGRRINEDIIKASLFSGHYDLKKTTDSYPNVARHSSTLSFTKDLKHKLNPTISVRTSADKTETLLFSQAWINGAKNYISEKIQIQYMSDTGVIIGRVTLDGKPVAGAQVSIENQSGLEAYYFDQFLIPQAEQKTTSENGLFIIAGVSNGSYQITAELGSRTLGSQQYLVESELTTYQEIAATSVPQSIVARSFDVISGEAVGADVMIPGQKDILNLESGMARYRSAAHSGLVEIINRPHSQDYAAYVYVQNHSKDHLHLPQIKESFIDYALTTSKIQIEPETSTFLGFTALEDYSIYIADENFDSQNILYFDSTGQLANQPQRGGGFLVFNIPTGIQEVILQDTKTDRTYSTVLYSRPSYFLVSHMVD